MSGRTDPQPDREGVWDEGVSYTAGQGLTGEEALQRPVPGPDSVGFGGTAFHEPGEGEALSDAGAQQLRPGAVLAERYEILARLGQGGMGAVYRVRDRLRGRDVALKVILPSLMALPKAVERFRRETDLMMDLRHEGIVGVYDAGIDEAHGVRFYTMQLLEGCSLRAWLHQHKQAGRAVRPEDALVITSRLLEALAYAHQRTVHRDLKPENIFLVDGEPQKVRILDFGIAKVTRSESDFTRTNVALGTLDYMAPEQRKDAASVDGRADLYAVSVILYEMLTGELPLGRFKTPTEERPGLPPALDDALLRGLESDPARRPATAERLLDEVLAIREALEGARSAGVTRNGVGVRGAGSYLAAALLLSAIAFGVWKVGQPGGGDSDRVGASEELAAGQQAGKRVGESGDGSSRAALDAPTRDPSDVDADANADPMLHAESAAESGATSAGERHATSGAETAASKEPTAAVADDTTSTAASADESDADTAAARDATSAAASPATGDAATATGAATATPTPTAAVETAPPLAIPLPASPASLGPPGVPRLPGMRFEGNEQGFPIFVHVAPGGLEIDMVYVPPGPFIMGSDLSVDTAAFDTETPQHTHRLEQGYFIARYETTWREYRAFLRATGRSEATAAGLDDHPAAKVTWADAKAYCEWAGLDLPTEPQWEKAARGPDGRMYPWGDTHPEDGTRRVANVADETARRRYSDWNIMDGYDDGFVETAPVGTFPDGVSPYGAHDMIGNVWEWCAEFYDSAAYARYEKGDLRPASSGRDRVARGGSWSTSAEGARAAYRERLAPDASVQIGIRPVRVAP